MGRAWAAGGGAWPKVRRESGAVLSGQRRGRGGQSCRVLGCAASGSRLRPLVLDSSQLSLVPWHRGTQPAPIRAQPTLPGSAHEKGQALCLLSAPKCSGSAPVRGASPLGFQPLTRPPGPGSLCAGEGAEAHGPPATTVGSRQGGSLESCLLPQEASLTAQDQLSPPDSGWQSPG